MEAVPCSCGCWHREIVIPSVPEGPMECRPRQAGAELILGSSRAPLGAGAAAVGSCHSCTAAVTWQGPGTACESEAHCKELHLSIQHWPHLLSWCLVAENYSKVWNSSKAVRSEPGSLSIPAGSTGWAEQPLLLTTWGQNKSTLLCPWLCSSLTISVQEQAAQAVFSSK